MGSSCAKFSKKKIKPAPLISNRSSTINTYSQKNLETQPIFPNITPIKKKVSYERLVFNDESREALTAIVTNKPKSKDDRKLIKSSLLKHFVFSSLPEENLEELIDQMKFYSLGPKEVVFNQGDTGFNFFIVSSGILEIIINKVPKGFIHSGCGFGELALMHSSERTATIITLNEVGLWGIGRDAFRNALKTLSQLKYEENKKFIESISFFNKLTESQIESLVSVVVNQTYTDEQKIVIEGDPGKLFYIIEEGSVECRIKNEKIRTLGVGEYFGEQALLYNSLRTASIIAIGKVKVLSLGRDLLISVLGAQLQQVIYRNSLKIAFEKCPILQNFTKSQIEEMIENVKIFTFNSGDTVISKEKIKNKQIWFVLKGRLNCENSAIDVFENIGAKWILENSNEKIDADYFAGTDVDIGVLKKKRIENIIRGLFSEKISLNQVVKSLKKVSIFRNLSEQKLESLASLIKLQNFFDKQKIISEGDSANEFYIIKEGEAQVIKKNVVIRNILKGDYFGERAILLNENRTASIFSKGNSVLWALNREDFLSIIDESIKKQLIKRMTLQDDSVVFSDLQVLSLLGKGTYSSVFLCIKKQTQVFYALKIVSKNKIINHNLQESLILEKKILLQVDHPFIVKLVKTFKDDTKIYFLQEFVNGICLYEALQTLNLLDSISVRFYTANLLLILDHLHEHFIVYRDLKPENLMVDEDGYLKLLDFGTAKIINRRTYTIVGTPQYIAPEVILGKGYGVSADLWSLGVMIYEFVCGRVPFGEDENDPIDVYKVIIKGKFSYPKFLKENCREKVIIEQLLRLNPALRGTAENLKNHKWLNGMNWENLVCKKIKAPYVPKVRELNELEKCLLKPELYKSLTAEKNRRKKIVKISNPMWDQEF